MLFAFCPLPHASLAAPPRPVVWGELCVNPVSLLVGLARRQREQKESASEEARWRCAHTMTDRVHLRCVVRARAASFHRAGDESSFEQSGGNSLDAERLWNNGIKRAGSARQNARAASQRCECGQARKKSDGPTSGGAAREAPRRAGWVMKRKL